MYGEGYQPYEEEMVDDFLEEQEYLAYTQREQEISEAMAEAEYESLLAQAEDLEADLAAQEYYESDDYYEESYDEF
jgi:hypothetical protein